MSHGPRMNGETKTVVQQRADLLHVLRLSPTPGGALRERFGHSIRHVISDAYASGLITLVEGDWYLTQAGQIAARGGRA